MERRGFASARGMGAVMIETITATSLLLMLLLVLLLVLLLAAPVAFSHRGGMVFVFMDFKVLGC
jgi:hypothetical protein